MCVFVRVFVFFVIILVQHIELLEETKMREAKSMICYLSLANREMGTIHQM